MKKLGKDFMHRYNLSFIFIYLGIGAISMALFEYFGGSGFRIATTRPLGTKIWLIIGGACLLVGYLVGKLRN